MRSLTRILLPVNLESHYWKSIEHGAKLASQSGAIAEVLYVLSFDADYEKPWAEEILCKRLLSLIAMLNHRFGHEQTGQTPEKSPIFVGVMQRGDTTAGILEYAELMDHDFIVMGAGHKTGDGITQRIVRSARSPVLVVSEAGNVDRYQNHHAHASR